VKKDTTDIKNKTEITGMISSQNEDTGLPSYNAKNTKHFEQKNMPRGYRNKNSGEK